MVTWTAFGSIDAGGGDIERQLAHVISGYWGASKSILHMERAIVWDCGVWIFWS